MIHALRDFFAGHFNGIAALVLLLVAALVLLVAYAMRAVARQHAAVSAALEARADGCIRLDDIEYDVEWKVPSSLPDGRRQIELYRRWIAESYGIQPEEVEITA